MPLSPRTLRPSSTFTPKSLPGLALWLDGSDANSLYTTDAGAVTAVSSPTEISGCVGWWDASDLSSMRQNSDGTGTVAAGDPVGWWKDKSATGANVTGSGSARPTVSATGFNSRTALAFNGSSTNLSNASYTALNSLSGFTVIAVCANSGGTANLSRVYPAGFQGFWMNGGRRFYVDDSANYALTGTPGSNVLAAGIYSFRFASSAIENYESGSLNTPTIAGTIPSSTGSSASAAIHIGSNIGANAFWNGPIAEYILFNRALTRTELARVEAYLAQRWGISNVHVPAAAASAPVGAWLDKSGGGRHSVQSTAANRPAYQPSGMNSKPALTFDTTKSLLSSASIADLVGSAAVSPAVTMAFVAFSPSAAAGFSAGADNAANGRLAFQLPFDTSGNSYFDVAGTGSGRLGPFAITSSSQTQPSVYVLQRNGTSMYVRRNGAVLASKSDALQTFSATSAKLQIGQAVGLTGFQSTLSEFLCYSAGLTSGQVASIERSLAKKYGITLAPQVSNADAQDWVNRVYANGGTVTSATASAVNTFCDSITNASLRDRFYRLNLFCGTGLNAALVPLYRGPTTYTGRNLLATDLNAVQFSGSSWAALGTAAKGSAVTAPDGSSTATSVTFAAAGDVLRRTPTWTGGASGTVSLWVRKPASGGANAIRITTNNTVAWNTGISQKFTLTTSWQRISASGVLASGSGTGAHVMVGANDAAGAGDADCVGVVELWSPQVEYGSLSAYEGPQYGNTTDTNTGGLFVSGDYAETGASGGLNNASRTKYLNTGFPTNTVPAGDRHLAFYERTFVNADYDEFMGSESAASISQQFALGHQASASTVAFRFGASTSAVQSGAVSAGAFWLGVHGSSTGGVIYKNGASDGTGTLAAATPTTSEMHIFGINRASTPANVDRYGGTSGGYSIGLGMTSAQAAAYNTAMQAFQTALGRNV